LLAETGIDQSIIDQVIDQWRVRLNACFDAEGIFEHKLWRDAQLLTICC